MLGGATAEIAVVSVERARGVREEGDGPGVWGRAGSGKGETQRCERAERARWARAERGRSGPRAEGKRSELGPRGWAGALGWTETGPRSRVGLLDRARLVGLSAGVVWAGFGLSLGPVGFGCGFVFPFLFLFTLSFQI